MFCKAFQDGDVFFPSQLLSVPFHLFLFRLQPSAPTFPRFLIALYATIFFLIYVAVSLWNGTLISGQIKCKLLFEASLLLSAPELHYLPECLFIHDNPSVRAY